MTCCLTERRPRIPLSAYIVQDMHELAQAHAVWHFVIEDEEERRPRMLVSCIDRRAVRH